MPASIKLQETFGDDLQVVFVESQGSSATQAEAFTLARRWLGGRAMWTSEHPFESGATSLPYFVLIGNDGRVLLKGNPLVQPKEIERQIAEQIKARKCAPADAPSDARAAWAEFNKGRVARAFELLRDVERERSERADVVEVVRQTEKEFRGRIERELERVDWMIEYGHFDEAAARLDDLKQRTKGDELLYARCSELAARIDAPERRSEREASIALARLLPDYFRKGGDSATTAALAQFAEKYRGTRAAARAERWAKLARG